MATIHEVAALAGVSAATVSRVFNGTAVRPVTAARVRAAAESLDYEPDRSARSLRTGSSELVAMVIPDIENPFFTAVARGAEDRLQAAGLSLVLCNSDDLPVKEARYLTVARSARMAGVLLAPATAVVDLGPLMAQGIPVVAVDRPVAGYAIDTVVVDNVQLGARATAALLDRGFTRVGCITGPASVETATARAEGWREEMIRRQPDLDLRPLLRHGDFRIEGGRSAMAELCGLVDPPDAVVVTNNLMALGAAESMGSSPRTGMAVIGDAPRGWSAAETADVWTFPVPARRLGTTAAELLLERVRGHRGGARHLVVPLGRGAST